MEKISEKKICQLMKKFNIPGQFIGHRTFVSGLINTTERVIMDDNGEIKQFVLQKINKNVFKNPEEVMDNISAVTKFIRNKLKSRGEDTARKVMKFYKTENDKYYTIDEDGQYWRLSKFIDKSVAYDSTNDLNVLRETGKAFGDFQCLLADFPVEKLNDIIPNFHNTVDRYRQLKEAIANNKAKRATLVKKEINDYLALEKIASRLCKMQKEGTLPLRVTHNDTKCNNVLFEIDKKSGKVSYLCAIDLDTIMPGLACYDFGDAVRFAANTCAEDEKNTAKVKIDMAKYEALAEGFVATAGKSLTKAEQDSLSLGAITMTIECGSRFLADYLNGDTYFKTSYDTHNLVRARCQLALAKDMISHYKDMQDVIKKHCSANRNKTNEQQNEEQTTSL